MASNFGPAAGASGGPAPRLAKARMPKYMRLDTGELQMLWDTLRDPLVSHVYMLLCIHSVFGTGEFLGGYARLIDLCTPPEPERGKRRPGPSMWQIRRTIDDLVAMGMAERGDQNELQGQLRIYIQPRDGRVTSHELGRRVSRRVKEATNVASMRLRAVP